MILVVISLSFLIDKEYDSYGIRENLLFHGILPVIP